MQLLFNSVAFESNTNSQNCRPKDDPKKYILKYCLRCSLVFFHVEKELISLVPKLLSEGNSVMLYIDAF